MVLISNRSGFRSTVKLVASIGTRYLPSSFDCKGIPAALFGRSYSRLTTTCFQLRGWKVLASS